ncbi:MAG: methyltransferase, TIGR04325 family [Verrucomicrobia bacterium]|nr:methyltransferase, TIGR04325 family [Verrucomicrobiota bacterium]
MNRWSDKARRIFRHRRSRPGNVFTGDYGSWAEAARDSTGYDAAVILEKTRDAILKVKAGAACFERDSVLLDHAEYPFPVLAGLLRAATLEGGRLRVLDFGGALGSSYFQCRSLLGGIASVEWLVVEQPAHVACGRQHIQSNDLRFYETAEACLARHRPDVLLLSGTLQYLPQPYATLQRLLAYGLAHVILDRTPFLSADRDRLTIQHVPPVIYPASYPAWFFSETKFAAVIRVARYAVVADFPGADRAAPEDEPAYFKGFILDKQVSS